ncbi:hypothetical protein, partial [Rhizobium leguminosarum]
SRSGIPDVIRKPPFAVLIQNSTDLETSKRVTDRSRWYKIIYGGCGLREMIRIGFSNKILCYFNGLYYFRQPTMSFPG